MTLTYFGLTSSVLPRAILVPPVLLPARQRHHPPATLLLLTRPPSLLLHHCPSERAWRLLPSAAFQPFSQSQHGPGGGPSSARGAGTALLGPARPAHGVCTEERLRCDQHPVPARPLGILLSASAPAPSAGTPTGGVGRGQGRVTPCPAPPVLHQPTRRRMHTNVRESPKAQSRVCF